MFRLLFCGDCGANLTLNMNGFISSKMLTLAVPKHFGGGPDGWRNGMRDSRVYKSPPALGKPAASIPCLRRCSSIYPIGHSLLLHSVPKLVYFRGLVQDGQSIHAAVRTMGNQRSQSVLGRDREHFAGQLEIQWKPRVEGAGRPIGYPNGQTVHRLGCRVGYEVI